MMAGLGAVLTLAVSIGAVAMWQRRPKPMPRKDDEEQDDEPAAAGTGSASKKKNRRRTKSSTASDVIEDSARSELPEIAMGTRCWHRQAKQWVRVCKIYYDSLPPYYQVTMPDGSERATVRARLDTEEEHNALQAEAKRAEAEERAEAAAAALLAEEEKAPRRKPTSEGKGSSGKKKK